MTIRDDLRNVLHRAEDDWNRCHSGNYPRLPYMVDQILAWLGNLDPTADPELIALHLRDSRDEIARLRETLQQVRAIHAPNEHDECGECELFWPCATAALAGLTAEEETPNG